MADNEEEMRSLALTPTWSVASVLTIFVVVSLLVERSIHRLSTVSISPNGSIITDPYESFIAITRILVHDCSFCNLSG